MAKSDTPLDKLKLSKAYTPPHKPPWAGDKPIHGFDTETADGDIFMLSLAFEGFGGATITNNGEVIQPHDIWGLITHKRCRSSLNMWYNLDFDANVLLKHLLDRNQMADLTAKKYVETDKYEITYIPGKFLKVVDWNGNNHTHYDASQFFYTDLAGAADEWLEDRKLVEAIATPLFGSNPPKQLKSIIENHPAVSWDEISVSPGDEWTIDNAWDYIHDNWDTIKTYARKDAELVRDLWVEAVNVGEGLGIPMGRPFSTGYLAESYLNAHLKEKPGIKPYDVAKAAWGAYHGGRFEVLKRGDIGPVAGPDINSAYPYILSQLPDPKTLRWKGSENPDLDSIREADYGFLRATITTDTSRPIQPFALKVDNKLTYPALQNYEVQVVKDIFINALDHGYIEDYEIHDSHLGYETNDTWYPFTWVPDLYDERKDFEAQGLDKKGLLLKIVLNSMFGKTCQTTPKRQELNEARTLEDYEYFVPPESLPTSMQDAYENGLIEWLEAGSWFNPFLATYITGLTRLELHKRVLEYDLEPHTVMLATDSLMIEKGPFDRSGFADDLVRPGLGNWDYDYEGEAFVIGAGVYQIDMPDGFKVKTRGFREADLVGGLKEAAEQANGHLEIESIRPRTIAEAIWQNRELSDIGNFTGIERDLKPDMDTKRDWNTPATFPRLLSGVQESQPIVLES